MSLANSLREAKGGACPPFLRSYLEHHPKRSEAGMRVQAYFVFLCMGLFSAFRSYKEQADEAKLRACNRNNLNFRTYRIGQSTAWQ